MTSTKPRQTPKPLDRARAKARFTGVDSILLEVTKSFIEALPNMERSIADAIASGDAEELTRHAHNLKGAAANFDAERTQTLAGRIEDLANEGRIEETTSVFESLKIELKALLLELIDFRAELETASRRP